jgi:hypothetical protein
MPTELEIRLSEFVDRDKEMTRFCRMLDSGERTIMFVSGGGGFGKSSLLARMIHECSLRGLRKSEITWTETQNHDYLGIMRKVRDDLGAQHFQKFTELVNQLTDPSVRLTLEMGSSNIRVAEGMRVENSSVGDIAGIIIKDNMFVVPKGDRSIPESERMIPLTAAFIQNVGAAARDAGPIVVFFDAVEKMTRETAAWVLGELFRAVQEGALKNVFFVYCGREKPSVDRFLESIVEETELGPLKKEDVVLYLQKRGYMKRRGLEVADLNPYAEVLLVTSKGIPSALAIFVDALMKELKKDID